MTTILYNIETKEILGTFEGGYRVEGQKPTLPKDIVELEIVREDKPDFNPETQYVERNRTINVRGGTYVFGWDIIDRSAEAIEREIEERRKAQERKTLKQELQTTPATQDNYIDQIQKLKTLLL